MSVDDRVRNCFKKDKGAFYARHEGKHDPEAFNDEVWLPLARKFKMKVRAIKDIVYPNGWFGGGPDE